MCLESIVSFDWERILPNLTHVLRVPSECWKGFRNILTSVKNDSIVVHSYKYCDEFPTVKAQQVSPVST